MDPEDIKKPENDILRIIREVFWLGRRDDTWDSDNFEYRKSNVLIELFTETLDDLITKLFNDLSNI
jgi:hypothetical protein